MSQHTERDMVWDQALQYATTEQSFDLIEIQDSIDRDVSELIIRDTLSAMVDKEWLSEEDSDIGKWSPGSQLQDEEPSEETEVEMDDEQEMPDVISISECSASAPSSLSEDQVYVGVVDRVTSGGSGNAIVDLPDGNGELNLGPIDGSAEGQKVRFIPENGIWARCLDEEYTYESYSPQDGQSRSKRKKRRSSRRSRKVNSPNPYKSNNSSRSKDPDNLNKLLTGNQ
ncbi:hypothetical protein [Halorubrum cibi]|uniref:Uncharacterized protein n=1 Tax=Halorubrum cibi TaxID=413815 RepID=A0A521AKL9_9EURY|nr:hypothetical protein [Halorubrum cibi]SMO35345.1 hypothetical protein SAMN06264867_101219 [Halorubrum cibi]